LCHPSDFEAGYFGHRFPSDLRSQYFFDATAPNLIVPIWSKSKRAFLRTPRRLLHRSLFGYLESTA
jgi:hypothetical protein